MEYSKLNEKRAYKKIPLGNGRLKRRITASNMSEADRRRQVSYHQVPEETNQFEKTISSPRSEVRHDKREEFRQELRSELRPELRSEIRPEFRQEARQELVEPRGTENAIWNAVEDLRIQAEYLQAALDSRIEESRRMRNEVPECSEEDMLDRKLELFVKAIDDRMSELEVNLANSLDLVGENIYNNVTESDQQVMDSLIQTSDKIQQMEKGMDARLKEETKALLGEIRTTDEEMVKQNEQALSKLADKNTIDKIMKKNATLTMLGIGNLIASVAIMGMLILMKFF